MKYNEFYVRKKNKKTKIFRKNMFLLELYNPLGRC